MKPFFLYNHVFKNVLKPLLNTRIFEIMVFASQRMDPEIYFSRYGNHMLFQVGENLSFNMNFAKPGAPQCNEYMVKSSSEC